MATACWSAWWRSMRAAPPRRRKAALDLDAIAAHFSARGRWRDRLPSILDTLAALGRVHAQDGGLWVNVGGR